MAIRLSVSEAKVAREWEVKVLEIGGLEVEEGVEDRKILLWLLLRHLGRHERLCATLACAVSSLWCRYMMHKGYVDVNDGVTE